MKGGTNIIDLGALALEVCAGKGVVDGRWMIYVMNFIDGFPPIFFCLAVVKPRMDQMNEFSIWEKVVNISNGALNAMNITVEFPNVKRSFQIRSTSQFKQRAILVQFYKALQMNMENLFWRTAHLTSALILLIVYIYLSIIHASSMVFIPALPGVSNIAQKAGSRD